MNLANQNGTEIGTTYNFCITGNHDAGSVSSPNKYGSFKVGSESERTAATDSANTNALFISGWFNATSEEGHSISLFEIKGKETD